MLHYRFKCFIILPAVFLFSCLSTIIAQTPNTTGLQFGRPKIHPIIGFSTTATYLDLNVGLLNPGIIDRYNCWLIRINPGFCPFERDIEVKKNIIKYLYALFAALLLFITGYDQCNRCNKVKPQFGKLEINLSYENGELTIYKGAKIGEHHSQT